ncbi:complement factor B-like [Dendropsophus ebraccatus]|uniref:complement factor B-like n=1 Tax=Dendropsophus ebraccatus TaxID=150705 RepID=UPI0038312077
MIALILLSYIALSVAVPAPLCDVNKIGITDGFYTVTDGGHVGSIVEYTCPEGTYPYPVDARECFPNGQWTEDNEEAKCKVNSDGGILVEKNGLMNIFIAIDASKRVGAKNFQTAKDISKVFIEKMASFDIVPRYAVISYASFAKPIVRLSDDESADAEMVIETIQEFKYSEHQDKQFRNTRAALDEIHNMMALELHRNVTRFQRTRNVILLMTGGSHNMGGDPTIVIKRIRELLNIRKDNRREDFLDIYVFGLGDYVEYNEIDAIASKKNHKKHVYKIRNTEDMKAAFDEMLDESEILQMCGLARDPTYGEGVEEKFPWIATISIIRRSAVEKCKGSIVSRDFVLTAAHCFHLDEELHTINIRVGEETFKAKTLYRHPKYNPLGKQDKNVDRSFDYDLALIQLDKKIAFSRKIRPICLPCTSGTSWALKKSGNAVTCSDHEKTLLPSDQEEAMFVAEERSRSLEWKDVFIKRGGERRSCLEATKKIDKFKDIPDIKDLITDNFLCTGGTEPEVDPPTCKGDAGGPLVVKYKQRFIQVGVISWGTINSCVGPKRGRDPISPLSRDFHTDLFHMVDWLKEKVPELEFLA